MHVTSHSMLLLWNVHTRTWAGNYMLQKWWLQMLERYSNTFNLLVNQYKIIFREFVYKQNYFFCLQPFSLHLWKVCYIDWLHIYQRIIDLFTQIILRPIYLHNSTSWMYFLHTNLWCDEWIHSEYRIAVRVIDRSNDCHYRAVIMFLVEEGQRNIFDHRYVEKELWNRWVERRCFYDVK